MCARKVKNDALKDGLRGALSDERSVLESAVSRWNADIELKCGTVSWVRDKMADVLAWAYDHGYGSGGERPENPFVSDPSHTGELTVRHLMEVVSDRSEFPNGVDTVIRVGDVEGDKGVNGEITLTFHRRGDVVLSVDMNAGDIDYV